MAEPAVAEVLEDSRLVSSARDGNRAAFGELYARYARMVHGILLARVPLDAKQSICTIGSALKCASAKSSEAPPPRPEINRPIIQSFNVPTPLPGCLICGLDSFRAPKELVGRGVVDVDFVVRKDGTVGDVRVTAAPAKEIESGVADGSGGLDLRAPASKRRAH